jgi:hypothetical protein
MSSQLAVSLYSAPLPSKLDSLTLTITRWFTNSMYYKLKNRLQIYIIKYILSQKLEKYIKLIKYKINITEEIIKEFDDFSGKKKELTFRPSYSDKIEDIEGAINKYFRYMKTKQIKYNELIFGFKYNICNFNPYFIINYKFFCDNGYLLPTQQRNKEVYYTIISPEDLEILINTPLKNKNNTFLDFYNQELEISTNHKITISAVYDLYKVWCENYNKKCFSGNELKENLKLNNFKIKNNFLLGVKIREYDED